MPGRTCRRDLISDLANELGKRGIRLCLDFHFGATDHPWRQAVGMNDGDSIRMAENIASLFEETSRRYGEKVWGFPYIDDGFFRAYQHDPPWKNGRAPSRPGIANRSSASVPIADRT